MDLDVSEIENFMKKRQDRSIASETEETSIPAPSPSEVPSLEPVTSDNLESEITEFMKKRPQEPAVSTVSDEGGIGRGISDFLVSGAQGALFGFGDELLAATEAAMKGDLSKYRGLQQKHQKEMEELERRSPTLSLIGGLVGGAAVPIGALGAAGRAGKTLLESVKGASKVGAATGALASIGSSEKTVGELPDLLQEGAVGGVTGGLLGSAFGAGAHAIGKYIPKKAGEFFEDWGKNNADIKKAIIAHDLQAAGTDFTKEPQAIEIAKETSKKINTFVDFYKNLAKSSKQILGETLKDYEGYKLDVNPISGIKEETEDALNILNAFRDSDFLRSSFPSSYKKLQNSFQSPKQWFKSNYPDLYENRPGIKKMSEKNAKAWETFFGNQKVSKDKNLQDIYEESKLSIPELFRLKSDIAVALKKGEADPRLFGEQGALPKQAMNSIEVLMEKMSGSNGEIGKARQLVKTASKPIEQVLNQTPDEAAHYLLAKDFDEAKLTNIVLNNLRDDITMYGGSAWQSITKKAEMDARKIAVGNALKELYEFGIPSKYANEIEKVLESGDTVKTENFFKKLQDVAEKEGTMRSFYGERQFVEPGLSETVLKNIPVGGLGSSTAVRTGAGIGYLKPKIKAAVKAGESLAQAPGAPARETARMMARSLQQSDSEKLKKLGMSIEEAIDTPGGVAMAASLNQLFQDKDARKAIGATPGQKINK